MKLLLLFAVSLVTSQVYCQQTLQRIASKKINEYNEAFAALPPITIIIDNAQKTGNISQRIAQYYVMKGMTQYVNDQKNLENTELRSIDQAATNQDALITRQDAVNLLDDEYLYKYLLGSYCTTMSYILSTNNRIGTIMALWAHICCCNIRTVAAINALSFNFL